MKTVLTAGLAALLTTQIAGSALAAVTVYTDRASFLAALAAQNASVTTDTLDADIDAADSITLASGVSSTNSVGSRNDLLGDNGVSGGVLANALAANPTLASGINEIGLPGGGIAFGADFAGVGDDLGLDPNASIILSVFDGGAPQFFDLVSLLGGESGFFGIIADDGELGLLQLSNSASARNAFTLDNLVFAQAAPIPLPGALGLFAGAAALLGWLRRR